MEIIAKLFAGLGLFFIGVKFVQSNLREITGRGFRNLVARFTKNSFLSAFWGVLAGAIVQSTTAVTFIVASLSSAGLIEVRKAFPILCWSNLGTSVLVFLAVFDMHLAILYLLGVIGMAYHFGVDHSARFRHLAGAFLGIALLFLGLDLIKTGANPLKEIGWFTHLLEYTSKSWLVGFFIGGLLTFVAQSTSTVSILAITMTKAGLLDVNQTMMVIYGTNLGSAINLWLMGSNLKGAARQAILFQVFFKVAGLLLFVPLFYLEHFTAVPLVRNLAENLSGDTARTMAFVYLFFQLGTSLLLIPFYQQVFVFLVRFSPPSMEEELSKPQYLYDLAVGDVDSALVLIEKEQLRLVKRFPGLLDSVRPESISRHANPEALHAASSVLGREISRFIKDLAEQDHSREAVDRLLQLEGRNQLYLYVQESIFELVTVVSAKPLSPNIQKLSERFLEGLHAILLTMEDAIESPDQDNIELLRNICSDRGGLMERIRRGLLRSEPSLAYDEQQLLLALTTLFERILWIIRRISSGLGDSRNGPEAN